MIQHNLDIKKFIENFPDLSRPAQIQKIYSTSYLICLSIRFPGKTKYFFLGRGGGVEGLWLNESPPEPFLRKRDRLLEYMRNKLSGCLLIGLKNFENDRCVGLEYQRKGERYWFIIFWKGRKLYFLNTEEGGHYLTSWKGKIEEKGSHENIMTQLKSIGVGEIKENRKSKIMVEVSSILEREKKEAQQVKTTTKKSKFKKRKVENIRKDLNRLLLHEELSSMVEDNTIDFRSLGHIFIYKDIKIKFPFQVSEWEKRNIFFNKIKAFKKNISLVRGRLEEAEKTLNQKMGESDINRLPVVEPFWPLRKKKASESVKLGQYKLFETSHGTKFVVGLNAEGNDEIRNKWGSKEDLWFHLDGDKSSHIIVKCKNIGELEDQELRVITSCLRDYSKVNYREVPVLFTQVKNLKGLKGSKGSVKYKKEKHLQVEYLEDWKGKIKDEI